MGNKQLMLKVYKLRFMFTVAMLLLVTNACIAQPLYIDITGGKNVGIPIAVLPFTNAGSSDPIERAVDFEDIAAIVRNDLYTSGHFHTLDVENIDANPADVKEVDFGYWKNFGASNLVVGRLISRGAGLYDVYFELIDVYKNNMQPLLNVRISNKYPEDFRALAHYVSDLIFAKLTGVRGFFSTRIAYITVDRSKEETIHTLHVADADGYNSRSILSVNYPIKSPRWSPDGKKIAYVALGKRNSSINIITVATGNREQVTKFPGINGAPAWSPSGTRLAMVLSKDGAPKLYVLDLNSKELQRITNGGAIDTEPFWDPNGQSIVFTSNRGGKPQIYRVLLQSGDVQRVTFIGDYNATPSLTPDGKQLIMLHQSEKGAYNIAVQDLSSGKVKSITSANLDESPTLAPNGMMVLYGMREADQSILGAVTLDGKFRMRLPLQAENVKEPAWSPFLLQN
jgi:TolB protein